MAISLQKVGLLALYLFSERVLATDHATASAASTITPSTVDPDPAKAAMLKAGSLAWTAVRLLAIGLFRMIAWVLGTVAMIVGLVWRTFVARPWELLMSIVHMLYPVAMFFLAAVLCGAVIGGCAGFASEAISWFVVTATWGRATTPRKSSLAIVVDPYDSDDHLNGSFQEDDDDTEDDATSLAAAAAAAAAAMTQHARTWDRKGKQPVRRQKQQNHHVHAHPYIPSPSPPAPSSKVEQGAVEGGPEEYLEEEEEDEEDEWAWEDEEDLDAFPRRRRWRRSVG